MKRKVSLLILLCALFVVALGLSVYATDKMPIAYYTFDEGNLSDYSGNDYDGEAVGGKNLTYESVDGRGYVLELNNKGLKRDTNASGFQIPTDGLTDATSFTLVMDMYVETDGGNQVWFDLSRGKSSTDSRHYLVGLLAISTYGMNSEIYSVEVDAAKTRIYNNYTFDKAGEWAQLAYVNDNGTASIYLDGTLVASGNHAKTIKDMLTVDGTTLTVGMATYFNDLSLDAKLDNVAVYDYALAVEELASPTVPETPVPDEPIVPEEPIGDVYFPELGANGLVTEYHLLNEDDLSFGEQRNTYIEKNINYTDASKILAERAEAVNYVAVRWTGRIVAPESGNYTFSSYSDNGIRMYLDGEIVLDWWVTQWDVEQISEEIYLEAGVPHEFTFEWMEYSGGAHVILRWENDSRVIKTPIPASAFYLPSDGGIPVITEIDTSAANLDKNNGAVGGNITVKGENLENAEKFELVYRGGTPLGTPMFLTVNSLDEETATFALPSGLSAGLYHIKPYYNDITYHSDDSLSVIALEGEQSRAEHPDPSWQREEWINLNGWWDFTFDADEVGIDEQWYLGENEYEYKINVPFGWESALSGIADTDYRGQAWYNREFTLDSSWLAEGKTVNIHFGAVDAKCIVYVNGNEVCRHDGGYTPFEADITDYVSAGENTVTVWVEDKSSYGDNSYVALVGKQGHNAPCGYTHTSGIWQTVYLESRSETYIDFAHANSDYKNGSVQFDLSVVSDAAQDLTVEFAFESKIWNEEQAKDIATGSAFTYSQDITLASGENIIEIPAVVIENAKLWSDRVPNLYYGTVTLKDASGNVIDSVSTYFGLRQVYTDIYDGRDYEYIFLNGSPVFLAGLLDQGYWREGIYTAPDEAALKYDIAKMKEYGFNMIRKHLKIEAPLQYYWCDKLGMFVWQDMPHATAMNATTAGGEAPGRVLYENSLMDLLKRDYNKPSVMAIMLFNETWGIKHTAPAASDGLTTIDWIKSLYYKVKEYNSGMLVEDMSPLNNDHIQPTDLNTFHMYPITYNLAKSAVEKYANNAYEGSTHNFYDGYAQEKEPLLNSEYGGVGVNSGDRDVSLCFKYQTDLMRMTERFNGYVYTEPYDIEYERNGILTYDRREKLFPYDEIAFGGDMTIADLNQPNHVGVYAEPAKECGVGTEYSADIVASNWSGDIYENSVLHWRFDATDVYGNNFSTGISGEQSITYAPYTAEHYPISFTLPDKICVGTLTVWIEQDGEKLAKNFVNIIVNGVDVRDSEYIGENSIAIRADGGEFEGDGELTLAYAVPEDFDISTLTSIRLLVEASSVKKNSVTNGISNASTSQTAVGSERPSDMTVCINGVEIDTVYIPDNPRDVRGTLTFNYSDDRNSSADNFGYLVDIVVPADKIVAVRSAVAADGAINVTYSVKDDAENQNGLRLYNEEQGRYALKPTVILNSVESDLTSGNYRVGAVLSDGDTISLRGGAVTVSLDGGVLAIGDAKAVVGDGEHTVTARVFDTHYQVYADNNPISVIDVYLDTEYSSNAVSSTGEDLTIAPETYSTNYIISAIEIGTAEELIALMNGETSWSENYKLTADIDLTGLAQSPIGNSTTPFTGTFDGNGKTVKGINISGTDNVGLFGYIRDAKIKNLTVCGTVHGTVGNVGGLVGYAHQSGLIENCVNKCTVISDDVNAGGIIGQLRNTYENSFTIKNCVNNGDITAVRNVGGIVGYNNGHGTGTVLIEGCTNTGTIVATSTTNKANAGGIMGVCSSKAGPVTVTKCLNDGSVTGWHYVGGIIGNLVGTDTSDATDNYVITQCWNKAAVTSTATSGTAYTGGIIGYVEAVGDISDNLNTGVVSSKVKYVGGLFGVSGIYIGAANNLNKTAVVCDVTGDYVNSIGGYMPSKPSGDCYYYGELQGKVWEKGIAKSTQYTPELFDSLNASGNWVMAEDPELKAFRVPSEGVSEVYVDGTNSTAGAYTSLEEALLNISESGTVVLVGDTTVSEPLIVSCEDIVITSQNGAVLTLSENLSFVKSTEDSSVTFDLAVKSNGAKIFGGFRNVTFTENFTVDGKLDFYGGVNALTSGNNYSAITEKAYSVTVNGGTFENFALGNCRADQKAMVGSIAAPVTLTVNGGTFNSSFSVSGMSILADDATLNISGGTFNCPIYIQGAMNAVVTNATKYSNVVKTDRKYYAIDGDIALNISGGIFNGGMIGAYNAEVAYTQVMRGEYTVTVTGGIFKDGTVFDATQVKAYANSENKATITFDDTYNFEIVRFDKVNGESVTYDEPIRIAYVGDSITEGVEVSRLTESYPALINALATKAGREVVSSNYGVGGFGILNSSVYYTDYLAYPMLLEETDADYIVIAIGTNDYFAGGTTGAKNTFENNFRDLAITVGALPETDKVFITNALIRDNETHAQIKVASVVRPVQEKVAKELALADKDKYVFVDLYGLTLDAAAEDILLSSDNLHPCKEGYEVMADALYGVMFENGTPEPTEYKSNDVYVSKSGKPVASGTKDDPVSRLDVAFSMLPAGEESTIHIIGKFSYSQSIYVTTAPSKLTIVGEGSDAILENGDVSFKIGCDVKFDNITLATTATTDFYGCYYDIEMTDTVTLEGDWSFYAGHDVYGEGVTNVSHDTLESASGNNDCNIILNAKGTFKNLAFGNLRCVGNALIGTYSGNLTAYIGKDMVIGNAGQTGIVGMNYLTGSITVTMPETLMLADYAPIGSITSPIVYDSTKNTGTVTVNTYDGSYYTEISTAEEFIALMNNSDAWSENYKLTADIDLTGLAQSPIGNSTTPFTGTFDGNGKTVKGINISGTDNVGLFGYIRDAKIKNLTVCGTVHGTVGNVGGLVGYAHQSGLIENCVNKCTVISDDVNAGGIIGQLRNTYENNFTIKNCVNNGDITATRNVGGIVGYNNGHGTGAVLIEGCTNTGTIVATSTTNKANAGGIMGVCSSKAGPVTVTKCLNDGSVTGWHYVGGIIGNLLGTDTSDATDNYVVTECWNKASVTSTATSGTAYTGGIIGYVEAVGDISDNLSTGVVSSKVKYVGGLFGASATYLGAANNLNKTRVVCDVTGDYVNSIGGFLASKPSGNCYYYGELQGKEWSKGTAKSTQYTAELFDSLNASGNWMIAEEPELKVFHVHTEEIIPAVAPTYTSTGLTEGKKCSVCGEIIVAQEEVPMLEGDIPGDMNKDGMVSIADVIVVIKAVLNDTHLENGDLSGDGKISLIDVIRVMKLIVK